MAGRHCHHPGHLQKVKVCSGEAVPGWQSRSKLSTVQLRCSMTDACTPRAAHPAEQSLPPLRAAGLSARSAPSHRRLSEVSIGTEGWAGSRSSAGLIRGQGVVNGLEVMGTHCFASKDGLSSETGRLGAMK